MRAYWLVSLFGVALACAGVIADDKPKADPPAKEKAKDNKDREVHVVGLYEGYTKSEGKIHGDRAQVRIKRPGKQVTLVLVSYKPMTWEVAIDKDTKLEKVILGGSAKQAAVKGLPEKVEVVEAFRGSKNGKLPFSVYKIEDPSFRGLVEALDGMTGQKIASFTGLYRAEAENVIVVEDVSDDERFSIEWPKPIPAAKLPKLTFQAHSYTSSGEQGDVSRSFGEFTLTGPKKDTLIPLPDRVSRMTYDPVNKKYYGIADHGLAALDLEKKKTTKIDTGLDVPEISWPSDITYDTKRNRVILISSGGPGYIYSYHPGTKTWEALAERPPQVITYHAKNDVLYGLRSDFRSGTELQEINAKGAVVSTTKIDGQFVPGALSVGPGVSGLQLVAADDKLVLLISPTGLRGGGGLAPKWSYMYLIDPKTGKAQLVWKEKAGK
jgi:hypothetical protein